MQLLYNVVSCLQNTHYRHLIAHTIGWDIIFSHEFRLDLCSTLITVLLYSLSCNFGHYNDTRLYCSVLCQKGNIKHFLKDHYMAWHLLMKALCARFYAVYSHFNTVLYGITLCTEPPWQKQNLFVPCCYRWAMLCRFQAFLTKKTMF